jgi:hypothetical protein
VELKTGSNAVKAGDRMRRPVLGFPSLATPDPNGRCVLSDSEFLGSPYLAGSFFQIARVMRIL